MLKTLKKKGLEKSFDQFWFFEIVPNGTTQGWVCLSSIPKPLFFCTSFVSFSSCPPFALSFSPLFN
jgi:hypothetical protein